MVIMDIKKNQVETYKKLKLYWTKKSRKHKPFIQTH